MKDTEFERLVALENLRSAVRVLEDWGYRQTEHAVRSVIAAEEAAHPPRHRPLPNGGKASLRPPRGGSGASDAKDTGQTVRYQARPDVVLPSMIPGVPREPWEALVVRETRWRYRLEVHTGALRHTYDDADPRAYGSREHAERKAKRIVDRLNRRDWRAEREKQGGTIVR